MALRFTLELSRVLSGLSPPLHISHSVVPKPHLSAAKDRFWALSMHSGGTHGIRSKRTTEYDTILWTGSQTSLWIVLVCGDVALTFSGQNSDADARVTEFDEGQTARPFVLLSDQQNIFGTDVAVYEILLLLCANMTKYHRDMSLFFFSRQCTACVRQVRVLPGRAWPRPVVWPLPASTWCWCSFCSSSDKCPENQICQSPAPSCLTNRTDVTVQQRRIQQRSLFYFTTLVLNNQTVMKNNSS